MSHNAARLLICYKGDISALVLFAQQANGSVCFPEALPALSSTLDGAPEPAEKVSPHPAMLLNGINSQLQLQPDWLRIEPGFSEYVAVPDGIVHLTLARLTALDPPHRLMQSRNCRLRTLPELRNVAVAELELLRRAYLRLMEG
jgi:hypothetical protein